MGIRLRMSYRICGKIDIIMTLKALLVGFLLLGVFTFCCQTKALDDACTPRTGENADECTIANSECITNKCVCKTGFIEENGKCPKALEEVCENADECVSNSKCDGTDESKTCSCAEGFVSKEGLCVKTVGETTCTVNGNECNSIENSHCDTEDNNCKCDAGYVMSVDKCIAENAAVFIQVGVFTAVVSGVVIVLQFILNVIGEV